MRVQTSIVERIWISRASPPVATRAVQLSPTEDGQTFEISIVEARYMNAQLILLAIAHVSVAKSAADVYACVEESPGRRVMADNAEVVCFEGPWMRSVGTMLARRSWPAASVCLYFCIP